MILLGSGFSPTFADVILVTDAVIITLVLAAAFSDEISSICAKVSHHVSAMVAGVIAHLRPR